MEVKSTCMSLGDYGRAQQYSSIRQLPLYLDTETKKKQVRICFLKNLIQIKGIFVICSKQKCTTSVWEALK